MAGPPPDWPNAEVSEIIADGPHRWHVQTLGEGPDLLLLHGAGASTHSWAGLIPYLGGYRITAVDLPGQGYSTLGNRNRAGLDAMAQDIARLLARLDRRPLAIIGHSAGAAIALRIALDGGTERVVAINGALGNFRGMAGWLFPVMAKFLALNPLTALTFSKTATPGTVQRLIEGTGSVLDSTGLAQYRQLMTDRRHVDATLAMMAQWSLDRLRSDLSGATLETLMLVGEQDSAVPPDTSREISAGMPRATLHSFPNAGHLLHETHPANTAAQILDWLKD